MIDINVPYLYQASNDDTPVANRFSQCGYTSAIMLMSKYIGKDYCTKQNEKIFLDWMEPSFGNPGIGEEFAKQGKAGRMGAHIELYSKAVQEWLSKCGVKGKTTLRRGDGSWKEIRQCLADGNPVMIGGMPTPSGHFFIIRGETDDKRWICNDPAGSAFRGYFTSATDGDGVKYSQEWMSGITEHSAYGWGYFYFTKG